MSIFTDPVIFTLYVIQFNSVSTFNKHSINHDDL